MSSELQGLLDAIRERPDEGLPRLALADWCMEQPDEPTQARIIKAVHGAIGA